MSPRNVRNFYITADIDGRPSKITGGPAAKNGGMDIVLQVRDQGYVKEALEILCRADDDGNLTITIHPSAFLERDESFGTPRFTIRTKR